jgi:uncharacterized protein
VTLPTRPLGRTGLRVPLLGLGTGPSGMGMSDGSARALYDAAIDAGVTHIDTAPGYERAQAQLADVLRRRRREVTLTTKAAEDTAAGVLESLRKSLEVLGTDRVDFLFVHGLGGRDVGKAMAPGGSFDGLREAKRLGLARFTGFTAHNGAGKVLPALGEDCVDVVMLAMNPVDRHTYRFEETVLPAAVERGIGVFAMKAYAGARGMRYKAPEPSALAEAGFPDLHAAFRYAAGLSGVASVVIGAFSPEELALNAAWARAFTPLSPEEQRDVLARGAACARTLGEHFGPAAG